VTARDQDRGTAWPATTNEDGIDSFPRIPNGAYTLQVEAPGFKSFVQTDSSGGRLFVNRQQPGFR
jgi:carboxypeptidase family protein